MRNVFDPLLPQENVLTAYSGRPVPAELATPLLGHRVSPPQGNAPEMGSERRLLRCLDPRHGGLGGCRRRNSAVQEGLALLPHHGRKTSAGVPLSHLLTQQVVASQAGNGCITGWERLHRSSQDPGTLILVSTEACLDLK